MAEYSLLDFSTCERQCGVAPASTLDAYADRYST